LALQVLRLLPSWFFQNKHSFSFAYLTAQRLKLSSNNQLRYFLPEMPYEDVLGRNEISLGTEDVSLGGEESCLDLTA
jgi:hypothetical protein